MAVMSGFGVGSYQVGVFYELVKRQPSARLSIVRLLALHVRGDIQATFSSILRQRAFDLMGCLIRKDSSP